MAEDNSYTYPVVEFCAISLTLIMLKLDINLNQIRT